MGLDMTIHRKIKDDTTEKLLNRLEGKEDSVEVAYWRKFWELQDFIGDMLGEVIKNCEEYELSKENIEEIMAWLDNNRDTEDINEWSRGNINENLETLNKIIEETDFDKYKLVYGGWW